MSEDSPNPLEELEQLAREHGAHLHVSYPDDPPVVFTANIHDLARMAQQRIADSGGPTITVNLKHSDEWQCIDLDCGDA